MFWRLLQLLPWAVAALYVIVCEFMDTKGRLETIEAKWPRIWKLLNNRAARLVLLIVAIGFLAHDYRDAVAIAPSPRPLFPAPVTPQIVEEPSPPIVIIQPSQDVDRHLTDVQQMQLTKMLAKYPGTKFAVDHASNDPEATRFALELRNALMDAKWDYISYAPMYDREFSDAYSWPNYFGVQFFERGNSPPNPAVPVLRHALLQCCGIVADGVRWPDPKSPLEAGIIYLWVGSRVRP